MRTIKVLAILVIVFSIAISLIFDGQVFIAPIAEKLAPGMESEDVMKVQQRLKNWGYYDGSISGKYDLKTYLAVMDFQRVYGLPVNGITAKDTLEAMGLTTYAQSGAAMAAASKVSDEQLLARAINGEARGEVYEGQVAVGAVILNRTKDPRFPKTIAGVIYQPGAFTAVSDGQINVPLDPNSTVVKAARDALNGWDPTNGCLYYWNPATATSKWIWSRKIVKKIGKHYFGI
ncbi:spore cortex-lytic enzyme [Acetivibrio clariflavus DSM 19732]|uniref:Spore cortex-lytic enzyme n=1 Tax=Acetivibrio clariflavus (strain DSM 19732 / NBRC 101661 / EBR45) TaxID=720554 RepID=G8LZE9_ACECE|nr:spore cortex-lytic enzyme [Acetivibrio clariflavus DSM 19732]